MRSQPLEILVLCTGNSARSILAEVLFNREGRGRVRAYSAGSHPKGEPHPFAIELLKQHGFETSGLRSKSWSEFAVETAPRFDIVITVCDAAAGESCPLWPGSPVKGHWGIADPAAAHVTTEKMRAAFEAAYRQLSVRIAALLKLPLEQMDRASLSAALRDIGCLEGATELARSGEAGEVTA
jgi:arsenate reductase